MTTRARGFDDDGGVDMTHILGAGPAEQQPNYSEFQRKHPIKFYWLTAGLCALLVAIIGLGNPSKQPAYGGGGNTQQGVGGMGSGGSAAGGFTGRWEGTLSSPGYGSNRIELDLWSSGQYHVLGQILNETTGCVSDVAGTINGTTLALNLAQRSTPGCGGQATAEAQLQGPNSLWMTRGGFAAPLSGTLNRVG